MTMARSEGEGEGLLGCDTLVATGSATTDGSVIFAKNSDRHQDECQHLRVYPARDWEPGAEVRCQYVTVRQARRTYRVLGSQPFWLWGFEHGVNERGVAIGNEAIWTKAPRQPVGLLGMDLIRLGLERGATARESLEAMTALLEEYGQGGSPRHHNPEALCYDSSFILADPREAWVLETSGRDWVARRVEGVASISNAPTIGAVFDAASPSLRERPGLDFARDLGDYAAHPQTSGRTRCARSRLLLDQHASRIGVAEMMAFLRDHGPDPHWQPGSSSGPTLCVHPVRGYRGQGTGDRAGVRGWGLGDGNGGTGGASRSRRSPIPNPQPPTPALSPVPSSGHTAASMVAHLREDGLTAWCSLVTPCVSVFLPVFIDAEVPEALARGAATFSPDSLWWRIKRLADRAAGDWERCFPVIRSRWEEWERAVLRDAGRYARAGAEEQTRWLCENVVKLAGELERLEAELRVAEPSRMEIPA